MDHRLTLLLELPLLWSWRMLFTFDRVACKAGSSPEASAAKNVTTTTKPITAGLNSKTIQGGTASGASTRVKRSSENLERSKPSAAPPTDSTSASLRS